MTPPLTAMLEALADMDPDTWESIYDLAWAICPGKEEPGLTKSGVFRGAFVHRPLLMIDRLQGCIRRAIAARNVNRSGNEPRWGYYIRYPKSEGHHAEVFVGARKYEADADDPAAALLSAYLKAIRPPI